MEFAIRWSGRLFVGLMFVVLVLSFMFAPGIVMADRIVAVIFLVLLGIFFNALFWDVTR